MSYGIDAADLQRRQQETYYKLLAMQQQGMAGMIHSGGMSMQQALGNIAVQAQPEKKPEKLLLLL